jgi:hypothetical protein
MTMPVFIGTFSKNQLILFFAPVGVIQFMSSIKMLNTSQIHHCCRENLPQRYNLAGTRYKVQGTRYKAQDSRLRVQGSSFGG